jgi:outer membrane protein assembly factor BamB
VAYQSNDLPALEDPIALALVGGDLFVTDNLNSIDLPGSVTELNASTGALVRVISGPKYEFESPDAIASSGPDLFVANGVYPDGSVTELNTTTGALVRVISGKAYGFCDPSAIVSRGADLFVANKGRVEFSNGSPASSGFSVTEVDASTGALVRVISGPKYEFDSPDAVASSGPDLFVANEGNCIDQCHGEGASVTELNASTGAVVRVFPGQAYQFLAPDAIVLEGSEVFVASDEVGHAVTAFHI